MRSVHAAKGLLSLSKKRVMRTLHRSIYSLSEGLSQKQTVWFRILCSCASLSMTKVHLAPSDNFNMKIPGHVGHMPGLDIRFWV